MDKSTWMQIWNPRYAHGLPAPSPPTWSHKLHFTASFTLEGPARVLDWNVICSRTMFFSCSRLFQEQTNTRTQGKSWDDPFSFPFQKLLQGKTAFPRETELRDCKMHIHLLRLKSLHSAVSVAQCLVLVSAGAYLLNKWQWIWRL